MPRRQATQQIEGRPRELIEAPNFATRASPPRLPAPAGRLQNVTLPSRVSSRKLGSVVSATSVRSILAQAGLPPAPQRDRQSWRSFIRARGESILARDFFTVDAVWLRRL